MGTSLLERRASGTWGASGTKKGAADSGRSEQSEHVQSPTGAVFRVSCAGIRHLFWQLIVLVARSAEAVLGWSRWRRRHQAAACRHHYRRRAERTPAPAAPSAREQPVSAEPAAHAPADLVAELWRRVQPFLPSGKRSGRPRTRDRQVILAAIVHQMQTGCGWNALPSHFPLYQTIHWQLRQWQKSGVWAKIWEGLEQPHPSG